MQTERVTLKPYSGNYDRLVELIPDLKTLKVGDYRKSKVSGFMDLNLDVLRRDGDRLDIALSHNYVQNGDVMADPDMEIRLDFEMETAEALSFQQDGNPQIYTVVYPDENRINLKAKRDLNEFLTQWLKNIKAQGHSLQKRSH